MRIRSSCQAIFGLAVACWFQFGCGAGSTTTVQNVTATTNTTTTQAVFKDQPYQAPQVCMPCHQRQYNELRSSVKSGYRNVSPLFNGLEFSGNLLSGGLLRPVYSDST